MLWACIYLPHLGIDCVLRRHPTPEQPFALIGGNAQRREIVSVNHAAFEEGLRPGQRLVAAQAICPRFATHVHDPEEDARWQRFLAAWAYRFSSQVYAGWDRSVVLEVGRSFSIMGEWRVFQARLREELTALGFRHRIALAPTPLGARVLAGVQDDIGVLAFDQLRSTLARVPVRRACLPGDTALRLYTMGVKHLRDVMTLPRDGLRRRFGAELVDTLDRMHGDAPELLEYYTPPDTFDVRIELAYEVENHQALVFPIRRLTADLAAYLAGRDGGVQHFVIHLEHEGMPATQIEVGLLGAERDAAILFELAKGCLERAQVPKATVGVRLVASHLPPFVPEARDLFDERPAHMMPWDQVRERLRARLGPDAVYQVARCDDPRPEHAWTKGRPTLRSEAPAGSARPVWLLSRPVPLRDRITEILRGPERLESGWWDRDARRDYYVVRTAQGQVAWAFTPVGTRDHWMLQGWFA
ncbi:Y-family DNA polymerase [Lysobacter sp. HA18]